MSDVTMSVRVCLCFSLTFVICKVMESVLKDGLVEHFTINKLIWDTQLEYLETLTRWVDEEAAVDVRF